MNKYSLIIGRFQPFHEGHEALIQEVIDRGGLPCVAIMDTDIDANNPFTVDQRKKMITDKFPNIKMITIPAINEVCYGRNVGYGVTRIHHDQEGVSAAQLRGSDSIGAFASESFITEYKKVAEKVHHLSASQGFWPDGSKRDVCKPIALAHSELSEALECLRMGNPPDKNVSDMSGAEVQLSDVLGILMDMEVGYGFEISTALAKKMEFNKTRGFMHGGKYF